jgi:hypothetical protein
VNTPSITTKGTGNLTVGTQSTGLLILNSQGGALALQSAGVTYASVSSGGISSTQTISSSIGVGNNAIGAYAGGRVVMGSPDNSNAWYLANNSSDQLLLTNSGSGSPVTFDSTGITAPNGTLALFSSKTTNSNISLNAGGPFGAVEFWYNSGGVGNQVAYFNGAGLTINNLAGTGTRTVVANSIGNLSAPVSDSRLKTNMISLPSVLSKIVALHPITYNWNPNSDMIKHPLFDTLIQYGFTAQDIQAQFPDLVYDLTIPASDNPTTQYFGYDEKKLTPILVKAIQEQQQMIQEQSTQITSQATRIEILESQLSQVLQRLAAANIA